jgi:carbon monoxide dehydrogenase subunit G
MTANGHVATVAPSDAIKARLDDPQVAASLDTLLQHADLLAILLTGLDEMMQRGDTIGGSLTAVIGEFRGDFQGKSLADSIPGADALKNVDFAGLATSLATLSDKVVGATPGINALLASPLADPQAAEVLGQIGQALIEGKAAAANSPEGPRGVFALLKATKDRDVARGLGFLIQVARAFGKQLPR